MKTFEQLKEPITPEIIKKMCELAEGFSINRETQNVEYRGISSYEYFHVTHRSIGTSWELFPLLLHRAVEGWNNKTGKFIWNHGNHIGCIYKKYWIMDYQPSYLTPCEMAILDCLIEVLK
jgi:hypothetical protein